MTDVDLASPEFYADPYPSYARLRRESPVQYVEGPMGLGAWLVTRYDEARLVLADPRFSKDVRLSPQWLRSMGAGTGDEGPLGENMLNSDPPAHTRQRRLVAAAFTRRRMEALQPHVQAIADEVIDEFAPQGAADLMSGFAVPLSMRVITEMLGIPAERRSDFRVWTRMALTPPTDGEAVAIRREGNRAMEEYLVELIATVRTNLETALAHDDQPDLISALAASTDGSERLSERELLGTVKLLLVAGQNTVNLIGNGMLSLLRYPDQMARLRDDPDLLPGAVEELLRYDGPIERATPRFATQDVRLAGVTIPRGSAVSVVLAAASHDPALVTGPEDLDVTREVAPHLAFGHGIHYCLGAPLARIEGQVAIGTLVRRLPRLRLAADPKELVWLGRGANIIRGLECLPVKFQPSGFQAGGSRVT